MNTRVLTAHIPNDLAGQLDQFAARLERPKGWIVKQALTNWIEQEVRRHQMTLEGLADVDSGRLVDHSVIATWARKLDPPA